MIDKKLSISKHNKPLSSMKMKKLIQLNKKLWRKVETNRTRKDKILLC